MKTNFPVITFLSRTWMLLIFMLASNYACLSKHVFRWVQMPAAYDGTPGQWIGLTLYDFLGPVLYVPAMLSVVAFFALLFIHLYWRESVDKDVHDGTYLTDWQACSSTTRVWVSNMIRIGIIIAFCILCAGLAKGAVPHVDERQRWDMAQLNPKSLIALDTEVALYQRTHHRYEAIQAMRPNGVPATILFCLHYRESDNNFSRHAHEGSRLTGRTRDEPKGRLPHPNPPYTFEMSAYDAYYVCEHPTLDKIDWTDLQAALDKTESFNGFGYRYKGIPASYNWSGTSLYHGGKFIADHKFSRTAMDAQLGVAAILKRMEERHIELPWRRAILLQ